MAGVMAALSLRAFVHHLFSPHFPQESLWWGHPLAKGARIHCGATWESEGEGTRSGPPLTLIIRKNANVAD